MTKKIQGLYFDSIVLDMKANNPKQAYQKLSKHVSNLTGTAENVLLETLTKVEKQQNATIGNGVVVAQAHLKRLTRPMVVYSKLSNSIDFSAADGEPVDIVVLVLSSELEGGTKHLQQLSTVARFFNNKEICSEMRQANDYESIRKIVAHVNNTKKAA